MKVTTTTVRWTLALIVVLGFAVAALVLNDIAVLIGGAIGTLAVTAFHEVLDYLGY